MSDFSWPVFICVSIAMAIMLIPALVARSQGIVDGIGKLAWIVMSVAIVSVSTCLFFVWLSS